MAANDYLDEEYFQIQDLLSILTDSLPKLEVDAINNVHDLVSILVEQNKAYGKKIISLFETLDSLYKSANPLEASPGTASPDFNSRLHQKIQDYEDLVKRLTAENEDFSSQIKQLSYQIDSLKFQNQGNLGGSMSEKKSPTISNMSPSPLPKGSRSGTASREISLELENMFGNAEYKKAVELLTQIDYKKPLNVGAEKYNTWLIIANRMKDSSFNEVLNKLKILLTFAEKEEEEEAEGGLDDSLDKPSQTVAEKIYALLDEKLPKIILKSEYRIESRKQQGKGADEEENGLKSGRNNDSLEEVLDDDNLTGEQLKLKVRYLNGKVEQLEKILREHQQGEIQDSQGKKRGAGEYEDQDELIRTNEKLIQDLQQQADNTLKLESQAREVIDAYEDLKDKYEGILKEIADYDIKCQDQADQLNENRNFIDRLLQENARLKEQYEFSEKLEDVEKFMEELQEKDNKIKALSEELSLLKEYQKTPRESYSDPKRYINDTPSESLRGSKDTKAQAAVETALQIQSTFLYSLRQTLSDLRGPILEILKNLGLDLPARITVPPLNDELDAPTSEAQRLLKSNNAVLRDIASELNFVKGSTASISGDVANANYRSLAEKYNTFTSRVTQAEEKLFDNLTNSIQTVSELITLLNDTSAASKVGGQMSQIHTLLQGLHTNITRTIQEYPDFSSELGVSRGQTSDLNSPPRKLNHSFKDKLVRDQSDIKTQLRSTLQHLESYQANEIYSKLLLEIERNQELQDQIETKNVAIYRQHLVYNEGIERSTRSLEQLVKLADSEEAQGLLEFVLDEIAIVKTKLREIVEANKTGGWTMPEAILKVEQEFEAQKEMWKNSIRDLQEANEKKIEQFIREIEGERKAHEVTHKKLLQLQKELAEKSTKVMEELKLEVEVLTRKTREREFDLEEKEREIDGLKRQIRDLERERSGVANQLERMKGDMSHIGHEKGRLREEKDEMRKALENINEELEVLRRNSAQKNNELDQLRREVIDLNQENDEIAGRLEQLKGINEDMQRALEKSKNENKSLSQQLQQLNEAFEKKQKEVESMKRRFEELERENEELKDYKASTEVLFKKTNEQVDQLKISYFSDVNNLKEENNALQAQKRQFAGDIERKNQEVIKLNQMLDSLQDFSNKQLETLKDREDKMNLLATQKRETEQYVRDLERRIEDLTEKNRRYSESINQNTSDVQTLKEEVHQLMEKQAGLQRDLVLSKQRNEELAHENRLLSETREDINSNKGFLEDKVKKMNEILQITKNELKNNRELLEEKNHELSIKEHEIMDLKETMRRDRESAAQADLVPRLKRELTIKGDELVEIRRDYKRSLEQIEKLNIEIDTLRVTNRLSDQNMREIERSNDINRNMAIEVETLRKSVKQRDEQFLMERDNYEREIQLMRKKVTDMQTIIDTKDKQIKNVPKSYNESLKSSANSNSGNSSYYSSLIESKDLEIKRLTQIVKSLTENLRDTQESKYKLKK